MKDYSILLPFAEDKYSKRLISITEAKNGLNCNCICPNCKIEVMAKQGSIRTWHFAHHGQVPTSYKQCVQNSIIRALGVFLQKQSFLKIDYNNGIETHIKIDNIIFKKETLYLPASLISDILPHLRSLHSLRGGGFSS